MLADIRSAIATIIAGVEGTGTVHQYQRWAVEWSKMLDLFKGENDQINAWMITRAATAVSRDNLPTIMRRHTFRITGIYGLSDSAATELIHQDLVELVSSTLDDNPTLAGTVIDSGPTQVEKVEIRVFGKILCHVAELTLDANERRFCV